MKKETRLNFWEMKDRVYEGLQVGISFVPFLLHRYLKRPPAFGHKMAGVHF